MTTFDLRAQAKALIERSASDIDSALEDISVADQRHFRLRIERWLPDLHQALSNIYGQRKDYEAFIARLLKRLAQAHADRSEALKLLDIERELAPDWLQRENMIGYVFYVEQFAGSVNGVQDHLDYLEELGVTYVHLMKLMQARAGENDGGYAVTDYGRVDAALGTNADLVELCSALRSRGMSPCVDLVLNHCAAEHPWAQRACQGDKHYQDYFHLFDDRRMPDAFEQTLLEVFPEFAPGNFTWDDTMQKWVWTTFNHFQWDLNWSNPEVFLEIVAVLCDLANLGVEVFRLDAVAFMWKRMGSQCQNEDEVFDLLQALRCCSRIASAAVTHKAEAIVPPEQLIRYFGTGRHHGKVSNIAYHNALMVHYWSSLASRDTRLMTHALQQFPRPPGSVAWGTYVRCHDDIGWAITDEDAAAVGLNGVAHRHFLSDYYAGSFPGSHARGGVFQFNPDTGDRRINGTLASLNGLELALDMQDSHLTELSVERILLGFTLICGFGGIPLLYMGDELGLLNAHDYLSHPEFSPDSRWLHRPRMDWEKARRRHDPHSLEGRIFQGVVDIIAARKGTAQLHAHYPVDVVDTRSAQLFMIVHRHPLGDLACVHNFSEHSQALDVGLLQHVGIRGLHDHLHPARQHGGDGQVWLAPYGCAWLS